jgi:hypothetical protein
MKMVLNWWIPIVLIIVALMVPTIAEAAGVIKIWPDQLIPTDPNTGDYWQSVHNAGNGSFHASLKLPVGARITKITYYHLGTSSEASTSLNIYSIKMGAYAQPVGSGSSTDSTETNIPVEVVLFGDGIIRAGYRYYITVYSANADSYFLGVKINYQE